MFPNEPAETDLVSPGGGKYQCYQRKHSRLCECLEIQGLTWITAVRGQESMLRRRDFGPQWLQSRAVKPNKGMESLWSQRSPEALGCLA